MIPSEAYRVEVVRLILKHREQLDARPEESGLTGISVFLDLKRQTVEWRPVSEKERVHLRTAVK